jgi:cohesin complex subunit SA-1/2
LKRKSAKTTTKSSQSFSSPLFDSVSDAVALFSGSRSRTVRVAATKAGLQLVTSLVKIAKAKAETRDTKQRQLDSESKKKRPNAAMLRALTEALVKTQTRIRGAERMIADAFTKIFTHRFRDVDASVRAACMENIGKWMRSHPLFFLSDVYLKYLGWSLSDKDAKVRRTVLVALRNLYTASNENLALMDTFNARFQPRVREMINDVDASVAAEAVSVLEALYEAGVIPREDMEPVLALLMDANGKIRAAAAAVVPALLAGDGAAALAAAEDDDQGIATTTKKRTGAGTSPATEKGAKTRATLMSLVNIVKGLGGSRARTAAAVDALWDEFGETLSEWSVALDAFLWEDKSAQTGKSKKAPSKNVASGTALESEQAAGLANLLACSVRRARGERLVRPDGVVRPPTKAQKESHERAREAFTQSAMRSLPAALRKWRSDEAVVTPLLETACHLRLEHYSLKHKESDFDELTKIVGEIFRAHSGRRAMEACAGVLFHAVREGSESLRDIGLKRVEQAFVESAEKLRVAVAETAAAASTKKTSKKKGASSEEHLQEDGAQFRARVELARLNALLSLMPPPSGSKSPAVRDLFDDLVTIVVAAAENTGTLHPRAVALATRVAAMTLSHALVVLVARGSASVSALEITEHVALRDALLSSVVALARTSVEALENVGASGDKTSDASSRLGLRAVPKAAVAAFAHLVVVYQRPRAAAAATAAAELAKTDGADDGPIDPADCAPAPVFAPLELSPDEDQFRVVWDACNQVRVGGFPNPDTYV